MLGQVSQMILPPKGQSEQRHRDNKQRRVSRHPRKVEVTGITSGVAKVKLKRSSKAPERRACGLDHEHGCALSAMGCSMLVPAACSVEGRQEVRCREACLCYVGLADTKLRSNDSLKTFRSVRVHF